MFKHKKYSNIKKLQKNKMFEFKKCSEFLRKKTKKEKEMKNQKKIEK
jgi:hypothetical protein